MHSKVVQVQFFAPRDQSLTTPVESQDHIVASVAVLFFSGCPSAIPWLVTAVVVYSVEGRTVWSESHVGQEVLELLPSVRYAYVSACVVRNGLYTNTPASSPVEHSGPNVVRSRTRQSVAARWHQTATPVYLRLSSTTRRYTAPRSSRTLRASFQIFSHSLSLFCAVALHGREVINALTIRLKIPCSCGPSNPLTTKSRT